MKKICCLALALLMIGGCAKEIHISLNVDTLTVNIHDELPDEEILKHVSCNNSTCPSDLELTVHREQLNLDKVGEYTIDVLYEGSGYPLKVKVVDNEKPTISVEPFTIEQYENIIWDREMFDRIQLKVSDNATDETTLYNSIKVEGLDPSVEGVQTVTFSVRDESKNQAEITIEVTVEPKPVVIVNPTPPAMPSEPIVPEPTPEENAPSEEATPSDTEQPEENEATGSDTEHETATGSDAQENGAEIVDPEVNEEATGSDATPSDTEEGTPSDTEEPEEEAEPEAVVHRVSMTTAEVMKQLERSRKPQVVYVSQTWCSHCQAFVKTLDSYLSERGDLEVWEIVLDLEEQEQVVETNAEGEEVTRYVYPDFEAFKEEYGIDFIGTPSIFIIERGKLKDTLVGNQSIEILHEVLDGIVNR